MSVIETLLDASSVHAEWRPLLKSALSCMDQQYLQSLLDDEDWLPGKDRLLAAFQRNLHGCEYILFGESPYPRAESANGIAFYDAAVNDIWSETGLSKAVNRATSLRNIIKTALLAENLIAPLEDGSIPQALIAEVDKQPLIHSLPELFQLLQQRGFLLFNATPVLHSARAVNKESRFWSAFIDQLLSEIKTRMDKTPTLVLWGKIAEKIIALPASADYQVIQSEHPYNISFIHNPTMQALFSEIKLLHQNIS